MHKAAFTVDKKRPFCKYQMLATRRDCFDCKSIAQWCSDA